MSSASNDKIKGLFNWCVKQTKGYKNVSITNFTTSWRNGLGFCAILHRYGPDFIDYDKLNPEDIFENCDLAFNVAEKHFSIPSLLCPKDMVMMKSPDRLCMITYLSQFYNTLSTRTPKFNGEESGLLNAIENINKEAKTREERDIGEEETENNPLATNERSDNQICAICSQSIYFLEKLMVAETFYHRSCYRENQLTNLKSRNKTLERPSKPITDQLSESNPNEENNHIIRSTERSSRSRLSPTSKFPPVSTKPVRSLDKLLSDKILSDDDVHKSANNHLEDRSSQSVSPVNHISVNASSVESLSHNVLYVPHKTDENCQLYSNKLYPSSLDNSTNSLNSSLNKKRLAPPPPTVSPRPSLLNLKHLSRPNSHDIQEPEYPEELNPFAEEKEEIAPKAAISTNHDDLNPFAEYMTDDTIKPIEKQKPVIKPRKRPAPKLPVKPPSVLSKTDCKIIFDTDADKQNKDISSIPPSNMDNPEIVGKDISETGSPEKFQNHQELTKSDIKADNKTDITQEINKMEPHEVSPSKSDSHSEEMKTESILSSPAKSENNSEEIKENSILSSPEKSIKSRSENNNESPNIIPANVIEKLDKISIDSDNQTSLSTNHTFILPEKKTRRKKLDNLCKSQDSLNDSSSRTSSILKPPAPARPPPPKREVRADTSYEFIPYEFLYAQLKELNEKQSQIEIDGRQLQNILWEADQNGGRFEELLQSWLDLVQKKNTLFSKEAELHEILKRQELEDRHSDLEYELRLLMGKQESQKTATEKAREEELIAQILDTVNARAQLIEKNDEELRQQSMTNEAPKSKNTLKKFFSIKRRSSSVGKIQPSRSKTFKVGKKNKRLETFTLHKL